MGRVRVCEGKEACEGVEGVGTSGAFGALGALGPTGPSGPVWALVGKVRLELVQIRFNGRHLGLSGCFSFI